MLSKEEKIRQILDAADEEGLRGWAEYWFNQLAVENPQLFEEEYRKVAPFTAQDMLDFLLRLECDHDLSAIRVNFRTDYDSEIQEVVQVAEDLYDEVTNNRVISIVMVADAGETEDGPDWWRKDRRSAGH